MQRAQQSDEWGNAEREQFWAIVRARMAVLRLRQSDVAEAIGLDRSALSRRLNGEIHERPTPWMVDALLRVLKLRGAEAARLACLAGVADAVQPNPSETKAVAEDVAPRMPVETPVVHDVRHYLPERRWIVFAGTAALLLALVPVLLALRGGLGRDTTVIVASVHPGGVWLSPGDGDVVDALSGPIQFAARAYPTTPGDPAIAYVQFTVSWGGRPPGPWLVACRATRPSHDDVYACAWDPVAAGAPPGPLHISFDVYDRARPAHVTLAPNGVHGLSFVH